MKGQVSSKEDPVINILTERAGKASSEKTGLGRTLLSDILQVVDSQGQTGEPGHLGTGERHIGKHG